MAYSAQMAYGHEWPYSTVTDHLFSWWFFGLPSSASTVVQDLMDTVDQAKTANLRVFGRADLYWDVTANANTGGWVVESLVLAPEKLREPTKVTTNYASGTMGVSTFDWDNDSLPVTLTVTLDTTGDLQTVVASIVWNSTTKILTTTVPVAPGQLGIPPHDRPLRREGLGPAGQGHRRHLLLARLHGHRVQDHQLKLLSEPRTAAGLRARGLFIFAERPLPPGPGNWYDGRNGGPP